MIKELTAVIDDAAGMIAGQEDIASSGHAVTLTGTKEWRDKEHKLHCITGPARIANDGTTEWYYHGLRHRDVGPAIELANGDKEWFVDGVRHRDGGPAIIKHGGERLWYDKGHLSRKNGPAIMNIKGGQEKWYLEGCLHREDGPAAIYPAATDQFRYEWWINGEQIGQVEFALRVKYLSFLNSSPEVGKDLKNHFCDGQKNSHHENGPARVWNDGTLEWFQHGKRHREDGPAVEFPNGDRLFFLFGRQISEKLHAGRMMIQNKSQLTVVSGEKKAETTTTQTNTEKNKIKQWPDDPSEMVSFDDIMAPLKTILEQGYNLIRKTGEWSFNYSGYELGKIEKQNFPNMKEQLSEKCLKNEKEKHSRSLMDVVMRSVFLMGVEQGRRMCYQEQVPVKSLQKTLNNYRERNKATRYQLSKALANIRIRDENPTLNLAELAPLIKTELERTRLSRMDEIKKEMHLDPSISCFKIKAKKKVKLTDLLYLANTLDPEICKPKDWMEILNEANCSFKDWQNFCRKNKFNRYVG